MELQATFSFPENIEITIDVINISGNLHSDLDYELGDIMDERRLTGFSIDDAKLKNVHVKIDPSAAPYPEQEFTDELLTTCIQQHTTNIEQICDILESLLPFDAHDISDMAHEIRDTSGFDFIDWMEFDEYFFENNFQNNPYEAARATHFGNVSWNHDWIRFDGYANLESTYAIPYANEAESIVKQWLYENF